jgi:hypothetical protein
MNWDNECIINEKKIACIGLKFSEIYKDGLAKDDFNQDGTGQSV